jgi:hypothetical protein
MFLFKNAMRGIRFLNLPIGKFAALFTFRSIANPNIDLEKLQILDEGALLAAGDADGFIFYEANPGFSFCIWESTAKAASGIKSERHREAAAYAKEAYLDYKLERWLIGRLSVNSQAELIKLS